MPASSSPYEDKAGMTTRAPAASPDLALRLVRCEAVSVAAGADAIKILLYYTPFDPPEINDIKHAWTERIAGECTAADVPFFLELVRLRGRRRRKGNRIRAQETRDRHQEHGRIFEAAAYGVDILKSRSAP